MLELGSNRIRVRITTKMRTESALGKIATKPLFYTLLIVESIRFSSGNKCFVTLLQQNYILYSVLLQGKNHVLDFKLAMN